MLHENEKKPLSSTYGGKPVYTTKGFQESLFYLYFFELWGTVTSTEAVALFPAKSTAS